MKNLREYAIQAVNEVDAAGIPLGEIVAVRAIPNTARRWGRCSRNGVTGQYTIEINKELLADTTSDDALMDTLVHEVLHTAPNCMNHGPLWKHYAEIMNRRYGYNIKRCTSAEEKGLESNRIRQAKYVILCENCGKHYTYQREGKAVKLIKRYGQNSGCTCVCGSRRLRLI